MEITENGASINELPGFCELLQGVHQELCEQSIFNATTHEAQGQEIHVEYCGRASFQRIKRELCEAPVLGMPTEKGMYVLDTDTSVVAISKLVKLSHINTQQLCEPCDSSLDRLRPDRDSLHKLNEKKNAIIAIQCFRALVFEY